jgi:hypothetical protein
MSNGLPTNRHRRDDRDGDAYRAGRFAHENKWSIDSNPYKRGTTEHREWSRGWRNADKNKRSGS